MQFETFIDEYASTTATYLNTPNPTTPPNPQYPPLDSFLFSLDKPRKPEKLKMGVPKRKTFKKPQTPTNMNKKSRTKRARGVNDKKDYF